jgi:excisionase family DNA binding protein
MDGQHIQQPIFDNQSWLTVNELSAQVNVPVPTLRDWVYKRTIPFTKVGRLVRFHWPTIQKWLHKRSHNVD